MLELEVKQYKRTPIDGKRFNLTIAETDLSQLRYMAGAQGVSMLDLVRRFIHLGLYIYNAVSNGESVILRDDEGNEKEIVIL